MKLFLNHKFTFIGVFLAGLMYILQGTSFAVAAPPAAASTFPNTSVAGQPVTYMINELCPSRSNCMPGKTTTATIYVPKTRAANVTITLLDGCDTAIDRLDGASYTNYSIITGNGTGAPGLAGLAVWPQNSNCAGTNTSITFSPKTMGLEWGNYYMFYFIADAVGTNNSDAGVYYYNHFRLQSTDPTVVIGIANWAWTCSTTANYRYSCPTSGTSYTSFAQPRDATANGGYWDQHIQLKCDLNAFAQIELYDLDYNSYGQTNIRATVIDTDASGAQSVYPAPINPPYIDGEGFMLGYLSGSGNGQSMYLPTPGSVSPAVSNDRFIIKGGHTYDFYIRHLTRINTITFSAHLSMNSAGGGGDDCADIGPSCTAFSAPAIVGTGQYFNISVTLHNNDVANAVPGNGTNTTGYNLGVINTLNINPPDDPNESTAGNSASGQWYPLNSGTNLANEYSVLYAGQYYTRMPFGTGIPVGGNTTYTIQVRAPLTAVSSKFIGVQVLDRGGGRWLDYDAVCGRNIQVIDSPITCTSITTTANVTVNSVFNVTVTLRNNTGAAIGAGTTTTGYHLGVINKSSQSPPDNPNGGQWYPITSSTNLSAGYSVAAGAGTATRMPIGVGIGAGATVSYTFKATAPSAAMNSKYIGVQVYDISNNKWLTFDSSCGKNIDIFNGFNLTAQPAEPILYPDSESPTSGDFNANIGTDTALTVNGISATRDFFICRTGTYNASAGTVSCGSQQAIGATVTNSGNVTVNNAPVDTDALNPQSLGVAFAPSPALKPGDFICNKLTISPSTGLVDASGNIVNTSGSDTKVQCQGILNTPYMRIYGGDILAGSGFGVNCPQTDAGATGKLKSLGTDYVGTGAQMGVFSSGSGQVVNFASNVLASPNAPLARVFSNTTSSGTAITGNNPGGGFGGKFCAADYWGTRSSSIVTNGTQRRLNAMINSAHGPVQYQIPAGQTINNGNGAGNQAIDGSLALYIDGDVTIDNDLILNAAGNWASIDAIPSLFVIVRGNIYIRPNVKQLDGIYVAMPRATPTTTGDAALDEGGRIYTCTDATTKPSDSVLAGTGANSCANQLVVNGAFVAKHVNFLRTNGSLRDGVVGETSSSPNIAEVFRFVPEVYLATPAITPRPNVGVFDSVVSLPPTL